MFVGFVEDKVPTKPYDGFNGGRKTCSYGQGASLSLPTSLPAYSTYLHCTCMYVRLNMCHVCVHVCMHVVSWEAPNYSWKALLISHWWHAVHMSTVHACTMITVKLCHCWCTQCIVHHVILPYLRGSCHIILWKSLRNEFMLPSRWHTMYTTATCTASHMLQGVNTAQDYTDSSGVGYMHVLMYVL